FLIIKADSGNQLVETNEMNNEVALPISLAPLVPDLAPVTVEALQSNVAFYPVNPQSPTVEVSWAVTNQGTGVAHVTCCADYWHDRVYVSTDGTIAGAVSSQDFYG